MCTNNPCKYCVEIISLLSELKYTDKILLNLGNHYTCIYNYNYNYKLMKKYYLMAIEKGNANAMYNLGVYYREIEKNYNLMKKYYLLYNKYNKYIKFTIHIIIYFKYKNCNYKLL